MISRVVHCYYYNYIDIKMKDREIGEAVFFFFFSYVCVNYRFISRIAAATFHIFFKFIYIVSFFISSNCVLQLILSFSIFFFSIILLYFLSLFTNYRKLQPINCGNVT